MKKGILMLALTMFFCVTGCSVSEQNEPISSEDVEEVKVDEVVAEPPWKDDFSTELAAEIEAAFTEIGEDPANIESIEYSGVRESDLFDRRDYIVTFSDERTIFSVFDEEKAGFVHNKWYTITTEEWHEGEPERELYPREFLVTIKFGTGEYYTNVNQWTWTGNGDLQKK